MIDILFILRYNEFGKEKIASMRSYLSEFVDSIHSLSYSFPKINRGRLEVKDMAKTKTSVRGVQEKKIVVVDDYKRKDGTKVQGHRRSTPN